MKNLTILLLLLIPSVGGSSSALYIANLVDSGRITVDGDLSEWTNLGDAEPIARVLDEVATLEPQDLSARFRCVVDELNLYVAVEVTDDQLVYGTEAFRSGESDDCLAIFFDGDLVDVEKDHFDSNDGQITVVREKDGSVRLAGSAGSSG